MTLVICRKQKIISFVPVSMEANRDLREALTCSIVENGQNRLSGITGRCLGVFSWKWERTFTSTVPNCYFSTWSQCLWKMATSQIHGPVSLVSFFSYLAFSPFLYYCHHTTTTTTDYSFSSFLVYFFIVIIVIKSARNALQDHLSHMHHQSLANQSPQFFPPSLIFVYYFVFRRSLCTGQDKRTAQNDGLVSPKKKNKKTKKNKNISLFSSDG